MPGRTSEALTSWNFEGGSSLRAMAYARSIQYMYDGAKTRPHVGGDSEDLTKVARGIDS